MPMAKSSKADTKLLDRPNKRDWPAENLAERKVADLKPYEKNARLHSEKQIDLIAKSIQEHGFTNRILIDPKNRIIAGHGRLEAAKKLGIESVPCLIAEGWTEAQIRAYVIKDNQLTIASDWDEALLIEELHALGDAGVDLDSLGFDDAYLDALLDVTPVVGDPEEVPAPPITPITQPGDVWILGKHRLVCGDSTNPEDVAKALRGATPHLMVTDPPYGVEYDADWRNRADRANGKPYGAGAVGPVANDDRSDWQESYALFPGEVAYVWHPAGAPQLIFGRTLEDAGFDIRMVVIWAKQQFPIGRGHYHVQHEPCYYAVRKKAGSTGHWQGSRKESTLWQIDKPHKSETGHSTQKPIECMARPIRNNSKVGDAVYEPFAGSGTTLIACEMEGRVCHAIEIEPKYCDVIVERWMSAFGGDAVSEADGISYDEKKKKSGE